MDMVGVSIKAILFRIQNWGGMKFINFKACRNEGMRMDMVGVDCFEQTSKTNNNEIWMSGVT
jgi:hypothetical protein